MRLPARSPVTSGMVMIAVLKPHSAVAQRAGTDRIAVPFQDFSMFKSITLLGALCGLTACGSSSDLLPFTQADIAAPSFTAAAGQLAIANGGGISFTNTINAGGNFVQAEITPGAALAPAPTSGRAQMRGPFALRQATDVRRTGDTYSGTLKDRTGAITLTADFGAGTLRGKGDGLTVGGRMTAGTLTGSTTYGGVTGDLEGFVGASNAVGVFTGTSATSSIAGGFVVAK